VEYFRPHGKKTMTIEERLHIAELTQGRSIVLPTPPDAAALLQRARASGIAVGRLYIVSQRLHPGLRGGYERGTGNLWCHYWAGEPGGERRLLQCLLVLLAHARRQPPVPATIAEDWENERAAWQEAGALASAWELAGLLPEGELAERLAEIEQLEAWHQAAGELAGSLDPFLARAAFHALVDIREREGWSEEQFDAALFGCSEDEAANAAVLAFDRTVLRATWGIPYRTPREGPPFGDLTLPQDRRSVALLREALESAARRSRGPVTPASVARSWLDAPLHLSFLHVESEQDAHAVLALCTAWLVEEGAELAAEATWWVYGAPGDSGQRIYRLGVRYKPAAGGHPAPEALPAARELWVLFPGSRHGRRSAEAACQRYILSFLTVQDVRIAPLDEGLAMLWGWLQAEPQGSGEGPA
jgi:hypothetical protein